MRKTTLKRRLQLADDTFTPSEAKKLLSAVIDGQINAYKQRRLSNWMKDNTANQDSLDDKIEQLLQKRIELANILKESQMDECVLDIKVTVEKRRIGELN